MYYITFFHMNQRVFAHKKVAIHLGPATFKNFYISSTTWNT